MTVSFVLNNRQGEVSEETRERVLRIVRELGYRPPTSRGATREICTFGVVAGIEGDSLLEAGYHNSVLHAVLAATDQLKHNLTLFTNSLFHTDTHQSLRVYCDGRCDGIIIIAPLIGSPLAEALHERGIPFVIIGDEDPSGRYYCVDLNNSQEARLITEVLIERGHRRIGFIGGPNFVNSAVLRLEGFRAAMAAHGLPVEEAYVLDNLVLNVEVEERVRILLRRPEEQRPTALVCWNDKAMQHVNRICKVLNVGVPHDLSLIGIDDEPGFANSIPPPTTLRQPYREIGRTAVSMLVEQIRGGSGTPHTRYVKGMLVLRDSVAGPGGL